MTGSDRDLRLFAAQLDLISDFFGHTYTHAHIHANRASKSERASRRTHLRAYLHFRFETECEYNKSRPTRTLRNNLQYWLYIALHSFTAQHRLYIGFILVLRAHELQAARNRSSHIGFIRLSHIIRITSYGSHILITGPSRLLAGRPSITFDDDATLIPEFVTPLSAVRDLSLELRLIISLHQTVVTDTGWKSVGV